MAASSRRVGAAACCRRPRSSTPAAAALALALLVSVFQHCVQPAAAWLPPLGTLPTLGTARTRLPPVVICPGTWLDGWIRMALGPSPGRP